MKPISIMLLWHRVAWISHDSPGYGCSFRTPQT
jgi:hypothetical protein